MTILSATAYQVRSTAATDGAEAAERLHHGTTDDTEREVLRIALVLGLVDGFLDQAKNVLFTRARPWHEAPVETPDQDPHTQAAFGEAYSVRAAMSALLHDAVRAVENDAPDAARTVAVARAFADRRGSELVNNVIAVLGASSATRTLALDQPWRELRAFGQAHPPALSMTRPDPSTVRLPIHEGSSS